jgi:hypothetical protein
LIEISWHENVGKDPDNALQIMLLQSGIKQRAELK